MTYDTKNIAFHVIRVKVSSDSRCSRTLPMNVAIESAQCGCERNSCKDWARSNYVESMVEYDRRQSIVSMCDT